MVEFLFDLFMQMGYIGVYVLMSISSSFVPFPSELVVPPAAYLASQGELNIYLIVLCAMLGNMTGALINYFLGYTFGRAVVYKLADTKIAHLMFINSGKIKYYEESFNKYGNLITFYGRLIPGFRQLISIPAGLAKMRMLPFLVYTAAGSFIWTITLTLLGYYFGANQEKIMYYSKEIGYLLLGVLIVVVVVLIIRHRRKKNESQDKDSL